MTLQEAYKELDKLNRKTSFTEEEEFRMLELLQFLLEETKDPRYAEEIGGIYYEKRIFDKALKYYEIADELGSSWAANGLGYIWYYGRTGSKDYEKAFKAFSKSAELNRRKHHNAWIEAMFKIADMYKNGYYVEKDFSRYREIIEELAKDPGFHLPEVYTRLAAIRIAEGREEDAVDLYLQAREELAYRLSHNRFFGDLNRMNWLVNDLYKLIEFDPLDFDLYDLYYLLKQEHTVSFRYREKRYTVSSVRDGEEMTVTYDGQHYRSLDDFFRKADLDREAIEAHYYQMDDWRVEG
ncbi:MAG: sel1 repeat family protein [Erysipelotrichaceae bacterium]|nr:sel1 repeat family protein [Erysipelotrichaceae bacterium]